MALDCLLRHPSIATTIKSEESGGGGGGTPPSSSLLFGHDQRSDVSVRNNMNMLHNNDQGVINDQVREDVQERPGRALNDISTVQIINKPGSRRSRGERTRKAPACGNTPGKRSSIYRGVTRHRWTGRYEAHLWDKSTWNATQKKKGKQVYLGAYDEEEAAARAYDLAALKYWGPTTLINFPVTDYTKDLEEMQNVSREEYLASLRRKSSGFSRGVSKYRGVARHHHNGRWEARIGRVFGNKYLYLGTYSTQEEAAAAYDMAAIEYRGLNAVTNFDLSRYIRWLRPGQSTMQNEFSPPLVGTKRPCDEIHSPQQHYGFERHSHLIESHESLGAWPSQHNHEVIYELASQNDMGYNLAQGVHSSSQQKHSSSSNPTALSLLLQSSMFKQMLEKVSEGHEVITNEVSEYGTPTLTPSLDITCDNFFSSQNLVDDLQTDIISHADNQTYEDTGCSNTNLYTSINDGHDHKFPLFTENGESQLKASNDQVHSSNDQELSLDIAMPLWSTLGASLNPLSFANNFLETC